MKPSPVSTLPPPVAAVGDATADVPVEFTGKPHIGELGYAFLFRNYRADMGKWQTADPLGYPDGWNNFAYGNNQCTMGFDFLGTVWGNYEFTEHYFLGNGAERSLADMGLSNSVWNVLNRTEDEDWGSGYFYYYGTRYYYSAGGAGNPTGFMDRLESQLQQVTEDVVTSEQGEQRVVYSTNNAYNFSPVVWAMGGGTISSWSSGIVSWDSEGNYTVTYNVIVRYSDIFKEPLDIPGVEFIGGTPYLYDQTWKTTITIQSVKE